MGGVDGIKWMFAVVLQRVNQFVERGAPHHGLLIPDAWPNRAMDPLLGECRETVGGIGSKRVIALWRTTHPSPTRSSTEGARRDSFVGLFPPWLVPRHQRWTDLSRSPARLQLDDVRRSGVADNGLKPPRPCVERLALLCRPFVTLIDADDARAASRDMVQDGFGHLKADAELLKIGGDRSAQIVDYPIRRLDLPWIITPGLRRLAQLFDNRVVDRRLCPGEAADRRRSRRRED